jgi:hypothetical protein
MLGRTEGCGVTWILDRNVALAARPRNITDNLDRAGQKQCLPVVYRLRASNPTCEFTKQRSFLLLQWLHFYIHTNVF